MRAWEHPAFTAVLALVLVFMLGLIFHGSGAFYKWSTHRDALRSPAKRPTAASRAARDTPRNVVFRPA